MAAMNYAQANSAQASSVGVLNRQGVLGNAGVGVWTENLPPR